MLPLIDHNPSDPACIYSILVYIQEQVRKQGIFFPCLTFDQSLWRKATTLIEENNNNNVCREHIYDWIIVFNDTLSIIYVCNIFRIDRTLSFSYKIQISSKTNNVWIFKFLGTNKINNLDTNKEIGGYK